jgi:hypothetical protein
MGGLFEPWHLAIFLLPSVVFLIPAIFYLITLQGALSKCAPGSRTMEPALVWLLLIPLFNLVWSFFVVMGLAKSLGNEFQRRGIPGSEPLPGQNLGIAMNICGCCSIIPFISFLTAPAAFVLWIIYWVKIAGLSQLLDLPSAVYPAPPAI